MVTLTNGQVIELLRHLAPKNQIAALMGLAEGAQQRRYGRMPLR
ncbi:MAG: hypothetical protein WCF84_22145 [Anaerolineae bacterium]